MKYYHVIIEKIMPWGIGDPTETRCEIICKSKVRCPEGWRIVGVCGYHEKPISEEVENNVHSKN